MKVGVFSSNQPRHFALLDKLSASGHEVHAVIEAGEVRRMNLNASPLRRHYFEQMYSAESKFFGDSRESPGATTVLTIPMGQVNSLTPSQLTNVLNCDRIVVFGSDYIKGWLVDALIEHGAINIHMGISPYFRGGACNFWAVFDGYPNHVGATIHMLSKGLDSGEMIYHALPTFAGETPFEFTMKAVVAAHDCIAHVLEMPIPVPIKQDRSLQIRYSRSADFTDEVIQQFFARDLTATELKNALDSSPLPSLVNPHFF